MVVGRTRDCWRTKQKGDLWRSKRWRKNKKFTYGEQAIDRWRNNEATGGGGDDIK